jgi:soluble lytic murein transglycosylase-like protein
MIKGSRMSHRDNKTIVHVLIGQLTALIFVIVGVAFFQQYKVKEVQEKIYIKTVLDLKTDLVINDEMKILLSSNPLSVYEFYDSYTKRREISEAILQIAIEKNVPVNLAFAVAYTESEFNPNAVNSRRNSDGTKDWGLFQLNDGYRESWSRADFFNIRANAREGITFLKTCLETYDGIVAIAAYNRGISGVRSGVSMATLLYVNKVQSFEKALDRAVNKVLF